MVTLAQLWMPIVISAALVFLASGLIWMVVGWHNKDFAKVPNEDAVAAALQGAPGGTYMIPFARGAEMRDPEFLKRKREGPNALITVTRWPDGMGKQLTLTFLYYLLISTAVAYVASRTLPPGTPYIAVFGVVAAVAILAYSGAALNNSIWFGKPWSATLKDVLDGVIFGLLTAGTFGWRWP
ncbi:MAG TPA: hypothetical protein VJ812_17595 [Gemmatimonadaceae bacterium]|jgi:hypothetical protein|nr:hypothetical protein [Gemmatimonadaceae bacterium]